MEPRLILLTLLRRDPFFLRSQPSNALPALFKVPQRNIEQSRHRHCDLEADITGRARDRARIPYLTHRRDHNRKAQSTRPQGSCTQRKLRWHVPGSDVIEGKVALAEIQVFDADRRPPCPWRRAIGQSVDR